MITYNYKFQPYKVRKHFIVEVFWTFFFRFKGCLHSIINYFGERNSHLI